MCHSFWGSFVTYLGKHIINKMMANCPGEKKEAAKKAVIVSIKVDRTSN